MRFVEWAGSHERLRTMCTFTVYRRELYVHEGADADPNTADGWAPCDWLYAHVDWVKGRPVLVDLDADMVQQRALESLEHAGLGSASGRRGERSGGRSRRGSREGLTGDWEQAPGGEGRARRRDSGNLAAAGLTPNTRPHTMLRTGLQGAAGAQRRATQSEPSSPSRTAAGSQGTQSGAHLPRPPALHARRNSSGTGAGPTAGVGPSGSSGAGTSAGPAGQTAPAGAAAPTPAAAASAPAAAAPAPAAPAAAAPTPAAAAAPTPGAAPAPASAQNPLQSAHSAPAPLTGGGGGRDPAGGRDGGRGRSSVPPSGRAFPPAGGGGRGRGRGRDGSGRGGGAGGRGSPPDGTSSEGRQDAGGVRTG